MRALETRTQLQLLRSAGMFVSSFGAALVILLADALAPPKTEPLDRIVAVIADRPLFLSELRQRARPHLVRMELTGAPTPAAKNELLHSMLERMLDEKLEEREADKTRVGVSPDEVDVAMKQVAANVKLTPTELIAEAKRQGMSEQDYRDEIRRQVLEGKLLQLRVRSKISIGETEARAVYASWVKEQSGPNAPIDLRIIVLKTTTADTKRANETLAGQLVTQAKGGADFCALVKKHSQDPSTTGTCGSRGPMPRTSLFPDIAKATAAIKPGEVVGPISFTDPVGEKAVLVVQRAPGKETVPTFESVKEQMRERAFIEATERERRTWLQELRKAVYVEVKL